MLVIAAAAMRASEAQILGISPSIRNIIVRAIDAGHDSKLPVAILATLPESEMSFVRARL